MHPGVERATNSFVLNDGRTLAFARYGHPVGHPLYFFHGFPGCRLQAALVHEESLEAGVCLVAIDRPGFGQSTPSPTRTIVDWPRDVAALADHLGHQRFGASLAEAYRQGIGGATLEAHLIAGKRGFRLEDIVLPVHVYQGGFDRNVPPEMGEFIARQLPLGRYHFCPDEGHLSIAVNKFGDCLRHFSPAASPRRVAQHEPLASLTQGLAASERRSTLNETPEAL